MRNSMLNPIKPLLTIVFATFLTFTFSAAEASEQERTAENDFAIWLGALSWPDLDDIKTDSGDSFDDPGVVIGLSWQHNWREWRDADLLFGISAALFSTQSDIRGESEDIIQRGIFITPTLSLRFGERNRRYTQLQFGAGWYNMDIAELDCDTENTICGEVNESFNSDRFGGFIGLRSGFGRGWFVELQAHYANFGKISVPPSDSADLGGPFYMLNAGYVWGN